MDRGRNGFVGSYIVGTIVRGYKMATKILKLQRKSMILVNKITENPEKILSATQGSLNLIREGGRTVGSGRVATIIE